MYLHFSPKCLTFFLVSLFALPIFAQKTTIKGSITDGATMEPLSFVSIALKGENIGTRSNDDGTFLLTLTPSNQERAIQITSIGFDMQTFPIPAGAGDYEFNVTMTSSNSTLKEVVIREKKYRNKNNPAVELIRLVVANRDKNRVENFDSYQVEQYEKVLMGFSNLSDKFKNKRLLRSWKFALEVVDTTKLSGLGVTPIYLQESLQNFYSTTDPDRQKILVNTRKKVEFPLFDEQGIERYIRNLYQEADIYNNTVSIVTNEFLSPIANNAWAFYRYYPADTIEEAGSKIVRLQFFPRNKLDMLLQGNLYIALDSTYPVTRIDFTVNPKINLNWVRELQVEQTFQKLPVTGKWVLAEESYQMDFGVFADKGGGLFGERYVSHQQPIFGEPIPDSLFANKYEKRTVLAGAETNADLKLKLGRHLALNAAEELTYKNIDSLQKTQLFKRAQTLSYGILVGFWKPKPGIEIGRINTVYAFNPVEGTRLRVGGRTNPLFSRRINLEGYTAYGLRDKRWKFGAAVNIGLAKERAYNNWPYRMFRASYIKDLVTPGVLIIGSFSPSSLATSVVRGKNDRFYFQKRLFTQYEHEMRNGLALRAGFIHEGREALGSLSLIPTDASQATPTQVVTAAPFFKVRYAPDEKFYETQTGWRQRISFNFITEFTYRRGISGIVGSEYDYNEYHLDLHKFSKLGVFGKNYIFAETGYIDGQVPYPFMTTHRANQTFGLRFIAYNMMNFMEFVSDQYAAVNVEQNFYGFFMNKMPLIRRLKLREFVGVKALWGRVSDINSPETGTGLYKFPVYPDGQQVTHQLNSGPYVEASVGVGNILKILRVDVVRRLTYLDNPFVAKYGVRVGAQLNF